MQRHGFGEGVSGALRVHLVEGCFEHIGSHKLALQVCQCEAATGAQVAEVTYEDRSLYEINVLGLVAESQVDLPLANGSAARKRPRKEPDLLEKLAEEELKAVDAEHAPADAAEDATRGGSKGAARIAVLADPDSLRSEHSECSDESDLQHVCRVEERVEVANDSDMEALDGWESHCGHSNADDAPSAAAEEGHDAVGAGVASADATPPMMAARGEVPLLAPELPEPGGLSDAAVQRWHARNLVIRHVHALFTVDRRRDHWQAAGPHEVLSEALDRIRASGDMFWGTLGCFTRRRTALDSMERQWATIAPWRAPRAAGVPTPGGPPT